LRGLVGDPLLVGGLGPGAPRTPLLNPALVRYCAGQDREHP